MGLPYTEKVTKYYVNESEYLTSLQAVRAISKAAGSLSEGEYDSFIECVIKKDGDYLEAVADLNHNYSRNVIDLKITRSERTFT